MKILKKLNKKMVAVETGMQAKLIQVTNKIKEQSGADGSTEKTGWIIVSLIVAGLAIGTLCKKFFPEFFDAITGKMMEMFNLIKF